MRINVQFRFFCGLLLLCLLARHHDQVADQSTPHVGNLYCRNKCQGIPHHHETSLELKETGVGVWRVGDDEVAFSWYVKDNELRLDTKSGGVIVGSIDQGRYTHHASRSKGTSFSRKSDSRALFPAQVGPRRELPAAEFFATRSGPIPKNA